MQTKDELINSIKEWITIDEEIKVLKNEIKNRQIHKKSLTDNLVEVMKTNEIDAYLIILMKLRK